MMITRHETYRVMPWKNGGGTTTEIAVFPDNSDLAGFGWRVSMATVDTDGPFSIFPDIDRTLCILEGAGMTLDIAGKSPVTLTRSSEPLAFPADARTSACLVDGGIVDLNVMTRRGHWAHRVERRAVHGQLDLYAQGGVTMLLTLGPLRLESGDRAEELGRLDCAVLKDTVLLTTEMPVDVFLIHIAAR